MFPSLLIPSLACVLLAASATAQSSLVITSRSEADATWFDLRVEGAQGPAFMAVATLSAAPLFDPFSAVPIGFGLLDAGGSGVMTAGAKNPMLAQLPKNTKLHVWAFFLGDFGVASTPPDAYLLNTTSERLDADYGFGGVALKAGEIVLEQWAPMGLHLSADNKAAGHPDTLIVFDSAAPTGDDGDLATPGYGAGNDVAQGKLLIVAENAVDADADGLVDVPDDELAGGVVRFDFDMPVTITGIGLVDVDEAGGELRFLSGAVTTKTIPVPLLGDNSFQAIGFSAENVTRFEVDLAGSGGIAFVDLLPCASIVGFDETTTGVPLDLPAGVELTTQFAAQGIVISAVNHAPGHPDRAILFDTSAPTGEDPDLATPGYGPGNDVAQRKVLILAEDDVDLDLDGLVDDPDDEMKGGVITFEIGYDALFVSATVLDVDAGETSFFEVYDASDALIAVVPLAALGDNSSQTVTPGLYGARRIELHLSGSGALAELRTCPTEIAPEG